MKTKFKKKHTRFNPKLRDWLNERDYVSGDWPDNLGDAMKREADLEIGGGYLLDYKGWPIMSKPIKVSSET